MKSNRLNVNLFDKYIKVYTEKQMSNVKADYMGWMVFLTFTAFMIGYLIGAISMKNVTSKDPRKKVVTTHFKRAFFCSKVTMVREDDKYFYGNCLQRKRAKDLSYLPGYTQLGERKILKTKIFVEEESNG